MKNFIKKIKDNKFRSALVGMSAFLFGFIAVNVFNSIGNTYAVNYPACYICGGSQGANYRWGDYSGYSKSCTKTSEFTSEYLCEGQNNPSQCYYCEAGQKYVWGKFKPEEGCHSGWTTKNLSKKNCENGGNQCYLCGASNQGGGKYFYGLYGDNSSCTVQSKNISPSECTSKNVKTLTATFNGNGGSLSGNTETSCTTTQNSLNSCKVKVPTATRSNYYLQGWSNNSSCSSIKRGNEDGTITLRDNFYGNLYACWGYNPPAPGNIDPSKPEDSVVVSTRKIYTVTYDLNGGKFIDGTTTNRVTYIPSDKVIGDPKTNPIKDGMKFKEWQLNGTKFDFSQKPTSNITLKAVYENLTEEDKEYYCDDNYVLEVATKTCYNVMKPDTSKNLFNYTLYSYKDGARYCYGYNDSTKAPGGIYFRLSDGNFNAADYMTTTGKNNADYSEYGYKSQESWVSKNTCKIATECTKPSSTDLPACEVRWDAIVYSSTGAEIKKVDFKEDEPGADIPIEDPKDDPKDDSDSPSNDDKSSKDIEDSPQTGDGLIIFAWIIGIGALGYAIYYFKKVKKN